MLDYKDYEGYKEECVNDETCEVKFNTCFSKEYLKNNYINYDLNDELFENIIMSPNSVNSTTFYLSYNKDLDRYNLKFCDNITTIDNEKYCYNNKNQKIISKDIHEEFTKCNFIYLIIVMMIKNV